jgi:D-3-phosphoglycerate dehydrogenase
MKRVTGLGGIFFKTKDQKTTKDWYKNHLGLNTARGKSVVTSDLVSALKKGKLLGAGLDVLEFEKSSFESLFSNKIPASLSDLLSMENVILSPHIAGWTLESKEKLAQVIADKIVREFQ